MVPVNRSYAKPLLFALLGGVLFGQQAKGAGGKSQTNRPEPVTVGRPIFPEELWDKPGSVTLRADVNTSGKPVAIVVVTSSHDELNPYAIAALRRWQYRPARIDGKLARDEVYVTFNFHTPATRPQPPGSGLNPGPLRLATEARPVTHKMLERMEGKRSK